MAHHDTDREARSAAVNDLRHLLRARAAQVIPGAAYNQHRQEMSAKGDPGGLYYEAALPLTEPLRALGEKIMPAFTRYLQAKDVNPERPRGVTVAVFLADLCYLLRGEDLVALYCEVEGLNWQAYHFRVLRWQAES